MAQRPNIVYFHTHDTGRMIDPYGFAIGTPNLAQFARTGALFRNAFSAAPTCSPSRAALLTGQCPHSSGMLGLAHRGFSLTEPSQHLATTLGHAGYASALVGIQHLVNSPDEAVILGYDERLATGDRSAMSIATSASDYIRQPHDDPFFLSIGLFETHVFPAGSDYLFGYPPVDPGYVPRPHTLPDTPQTRGDIAAFVSAAREVDRALGMCLEALEQAGLSDSTLVIVTTDHGAPFPGMKCTLSDFGTGVMLLMRGPGLPSGHISDQLVSQIDIYPTICDLLRLERLPWLQGTSLLPALQQGLEVNSAVYSEVTFHAAYEPQRAVRTNRWKYIRRFDEFDGPVLANVDDTAGKALLVDAEWRTRPVAREALYDLIFDPNEANNLVDSPHHQQVRESLAGDLHRWMIGTRDPLLDGPVPRPAGAVVGRATDLSPSQSRG